MDDEPNATIPVFWNWNFNQFMGEATLTPDGGIKIRIRPSKDTEGLYEMAVKGGLRSFSLGFTADMKKTSEEELDKIITIREKLR